MTAVLIADSGVSLSPRHPQDTWATMVDQQLHFELSSEPALSPLQAVMMGNVCIARFRCHIVLFWYIYKTTKFLCWVFSRKHKQFQRVLMRVLTIILAEGESAGSEDNSKWSCWSTIVAQVSWGWRGERDTPLSAISTAVIGTLQEKRKIIKMLLNHLCSTGAARYSYICLGIDFVLF